MADIIKISDIEKINIKDLEGNFLLVKVGDNKRPATTEDLKAISNQLHNVFKDINVRVIVTHHSIDFSVVSLPSK